jgi:hypothetical protein
MKKFFSLASLAAMAMLAGPSYAQQITSLTNYALNANGHDIIRDIGVTEDYTKITVGAYQPSTNAPYDGFIWSNQTDDSYDWRVIVHGNGNDEVNAVDVRRVWNGTEYVEDIYVTGYFTGTVTFTRYVWYPIGYVDDFLTMNSPYGSNDCTYFVAKLNQYGGLAWIQYSGNTTQANTEIGNDVDVCVVGSEVQVYTTGFFRGNPYFYQGSTPTTQVFSATSWNSAFACKYIDNGTTASLSWVRTVNDNTNNQHDYGYGVCGDGSGDVYMCGSIGNTAVVGSFTMTVSGNDEAMAVKYSSAGNPVWAQSFGGNGTIQTPSDQARCITHRGTEVYVSGYLNGNGGAFPQGSAGTVDAFVMTLDSDLGTLGWRNVIRSLTGTEAAYKHSFSEDGSKIFVVGQIGADANIYCSSLSSSGTIQSTNGGSYATGFFASFYTSGGALIDHEWVGGYDNTCTFTTVETFTDDEVLFGGVFKDYTVYESGDNFTATNSNTNTNYITFYNDGFLGTYDCDDLFIAPYVTVDEDAGDRGGVLGLNIFPNPTRACITLTKNNDADAQVEVCDLSGRTVIGQSFMSAVQTTIDLTTLDAGVYLVRVTEGNNSEIIRVNKE